MKCIVGEWLTFRSLLSFSPRNPLLVIGDGGREEGGGGDKRRGGRELINKGTYPHGPKLSRANARKMFGHHLQHQTQLTLHTHENICDRH